MTPAINLLRQQGIAHRVLSYDHDPAAASYGREAVDKLGLAAASVFKTLLAASETNELLWPSCRWPASSTSRRWRRQPAAGSV